MEKLCVVVGGLNFVVELILLMAVDRLSGYPTPRHRMLIAAVVCAAHSAICLTGKLVLVSHSLWRWGLMALLGLYLYGGRSKMLPRLGIMLLLNFGVEGFRQLTYQNQLASFAVAGVLVAFICVLCFRDSAGSRYVSVELRYADTRVEFTALLDTGNTLRDPISGEGVVVVSHKVAAQLTGLTRQQLAHPMETMEHCHIPGLRLIPYHCVSCDHGMLLAMRFPNGKIGGKEKALLVAFAPAGLGKEGTFQALAGGVL